MICKHRHCRKRIVIEAATATVTRTEMALLIVMTAAAAALMDYGGEGGSGSRRGSYLADD